MVVTLPIHCLVGACLPVPLAVGSGASAALEFGLLGLAVVGVGLLARVAWSLAGLVKRVARLEDFAHRATRAEAPAAVPPKVLELGRVEGLLEDLRDVQRRLDDRLAALAERASAPPVYVAAAAHQGALPEAAVLVERALNRLLALGYEQIEVITPRDAVSGDGVIVVEARRSGAVHKGEVLLAGGAVVDVALRPSYELFP